jgi:hypothetical protein
MPYPTVANATEIAMALMSLVDLDRFHRSVVLLVFMWISSDYATAPTDEPQPRAVGSARFEVMRRRKRRRLGR